MKKNRYYLSRFLLCIFLAAVGSREGYAQLMASATETIPANIPLAKTALSVKGRVTSEKGEALVGVNVILKGTTTGITTDANGDYTINVPDETAVLVFSFIGYKKREVAVGNQTILNVTMQPDNQTLNEVVVTAYSSQRKKDITGAVAVVNVNDITKQPTGFVTNQLQGQAAGVTVISSGQPGSDPQIRIRGINTFGNNTPLYIVDGVPTQNITNLNPNDVGSIQVLKDAGAASIYGSRASNGVIIITTKKGHGKINVQYDGFYGVQTPQSGNVWNLLNPQEEANLRWVANKNSGIAINDPMYGKGATPVLPDYILPLGKMEGDPAVDPAKYYVNPNYTSADDYNTFYRIIRANKAGTDWFHEVFKPATNTSHNLTINGGTERGSYLFSLNYLNQQGTLLSTYLKRYTLRSNTQFNVSDHIRIGENLTYTISQNPKIDEQANSNVISVTYSMAPILPVYDIKGNYAGAFNTGYNGNNPVATLQRNARSNRDMGHRLFGNMYAEIDFLKNFTLRTNFGGETYFNSARSFWYPMYENPENSNTNSYSQSSNTGYTWTWTNTLTFQKQFGTNHDLKVVVGTEAYKNYFENLGGTTLSYFTFDPNYTTLSTGSGIQTNYSGRSQETLSSEFGRVDYSFQDKYLLSGTIRRDGSSKFVEEQYGWFPAVSAGWRVSKENFMTGINWLSDLKLRASWGVMGNQLNVNANNGYYTFVMDKSASYYDLGRTNNSNMAGFQVGQIGNPNAKWEKNINANIGIDATLLNGAIDISADVFRKDIKDLLYNPAIPGTQGVGTVPFVNIAGVKNTGLDLSINGNKTFGSELRATLGLTFTTYKNDVTQVTDNTNFFFSPGRQHNGVDFVRNEVGHPIGSFYGYQIEGFWNSTEELNQANAKAKQASGDPAAVYQTDQALGRFRYADTNGDGRITPEDRVFLGNPNPDFNYGINLGLTYKQFDFSAFFYGVQGNDLWNYNLFYTDFYASFLQAKSKTAYYDAWTPENHNAKVAIQETKMTFSSNGAPNSYYVENGSYLKLKNMQIGYNLPTALSKKVGVEKLRVYVQAANLFTLTKYTGLDPEISGSAVSFGVDRGVYPNDRQYLMGLRLSF